MPSCQAAVRFLFSLPFLLSLAYPSSAAEKPLRQTIDDELRSAWSKQKVTPAPRADDAAFLRRVYLDLVGVVPTYEETKSFLADSDAQKRTKLIDKLLADPRFGVQQANVWDLVLFGRNPSGGDATRKRDGFKKWLAEQFAKNVPYDQWVRELLHAEQQGPELFYVQFRNQPEDATVAVSRIFLGTQLQCARCHDHPYENWTQRDFYGMAGFFVRLVVLDPGGGKDKMYKIGEKSTGEVLFTGSVKEQRPGQKGEPVKPRFLGGKELDEPALPKDFKEDLKGKKELPKPAFSRKEKLAGWLTAADNPYFARAAANRVWSQFMGRGLVHPVDDLNPKNPASHPALFEALTQRLLESKFDLKGLIREIVHSEGYQLASTGPVKEAMPEWFERARVRPLSAEELLASFQAATSFPADGFKASGTPTEYFLRYFGEPNDGQGNFQGGLGEHLFLNNAPQVRMFAQQRKGNLADTLLAMKGPVEEKVDRLFLSVLNRPPSQAERVRFAQHLQGDAKTASTLTEEAIWVLLSCSEFRFNH